MSPAFDELPVECLANCLRFLSTVDIVRCRLINKKLRFTVDNRLELRCLAIFLNTAPFNTIWFHANRPVDLKCSLKAKDLDFLQLKSVRWLFKSLKRLFVYGELLNGRTFDVRELNAFTKLEHLEIHELRLEQANVSLQRLKIFNFFPTLPPNGRADGHANGRTVSFLCPQLVSLRTLSGGRHFYYTNQIKYLEARAYHPSMAKFRSLQVLKVQCLTGVATDFLAGLRDIREILFFSGSLLIGTPFDELQRQRTLFAIKSLRIYFLGIEFERLPQNEINAIADRYCLSEENFPLYMANWRTGHLSGYIPFIDRIDFCADLARHWSELSDSFFRHFAAVSTVTVQRPVTDVEGFLEFLASAKCLNTLTLNSAELPQRALDRLPTICDSLSDLEILSDTAIDCNFILSLRHLTRISVNQCLSFEFAHSLLNRFRFIKSLVFRYAENEIRIVKKGERMFESNAFGIVLQHNSLVNLIKFLRCHNEVGLNLRLKCSNRPNQYSDLFAL